MDAVVVELHAGGAVVQVDAPVQRHEYADCALKVAGQDIALFAHVIQVDGSEVRLRWLHFDPAEEKALALRLAGLLGDGPKPAAPTGTGRIEAPARKGMVMPNQGTGRATAPAADEAPERAGRKVVMPSRPEAAKPAGVDAAEAKPATRRVVQPSAKPAQPIKPAAPATPAAAPKAEAPRVTATAPAATAPAEALPAAPTAVTTVNPPAARSGDEDLHPAPAAERPALSADAALTGDWRKAPMPQLSPAETAGQVALVPTERFKQLEDAESGGTGRLSAEDQNVSARILRSARTVSASELAARHDKVRVLNLSTIRRLIKESIQDSLADLNRGYTSDDEAKLMAEVEQRVNEAMKSFKAEKADLAARSEKLQAQLEEARKQLENEKKRKIDADRFTMSESGVADLQQRFDRMLQAAIRANGVNDALAAELQQMVAHILDKEREKIAEHARAAQQDAIALLEKKVQRLAASLDETSKDRDRSRRRLAAIEASGGGLRNIMEAGLDDDDPDKERKLDLMKEIFKQNQEMREQYKAKFGELPKGRAKPAAPAAAATDAAATAPADAAVAATAAAVVAEAAPAVETSPAETDSDETTPDDNTPTVNPDDEPWSGPPPKAAEDDERSVKRVTAYKDFAPPPLVGPEPEEAPIDAIVDDDATDENETPPVNPDDEPWDGPTEPPPGHGTVKIPGA
jgi:hypothetical protein